MDVNTEAVNKMLRKVFENKSFVQNIAQVVFEDEAFKNKIREIVAEEIAKTKAETNDKPTL